MGRSKDGVVAPMARCLFSEWLSPDKVALSRCGFAPRACRKVSASLTATESEDMASASIGRLCGDITAAGADDTCTFDQFMAKLGKFDHMLSTLAEDVPKLSRLSYEPKHQELIAASHVIEANVRSGVGQLQAKMGMLFEPLVQARGLGICVWLYFGYPLCPTCANTITTAATQLRVNIWANVGFGSCCMGCGGPDRYYWGHAAKAS